MRVLRETAKSINFVSYWMDEPYERPAKYKTPERWLRGNWGPSPHVGVKASYVGQGTFLPSLFVSEDGDETRETHSDTINEGSGEAVQRSSPSFESEAEETGGTGDYPDQA